MTELELAAKAIADVIDAYPAAAAQLRRVGLKVSDELPRTLPINRELLLALHAAVKRAPASAAPAAGGGA